MNEFQRGCVVVVDNDPNDAQAIMRIFSRAGVAATCYRGEIEEDLPKKPMTGIRLAVLDMDLTGGYHGSGSTAGIIGTVMGVLQRLIAKDNGPYIALVWTSYEELVKDFDAALQREPEIAPVFLSQISKPEMSIGEKEYNEKAITKKVVAIMDAAQPLDLLLDWEQRVYDASKDVTNEISKLGLSSGQGPANPGKAGATPDDHRAAWKKGTKSILRSLAIASGGDNLSPERAIAALFESLNPIHFDKLESSPATIAGAPTKKAGPLLDKATVKPNNDCCGAINKMILFADVASGGTIDYRPGNLYSDVKNLKPSFKKDELLKDLFNSKVNLETIRVACKIVLLEMTPACDFFQGKAKIARLVAGILCPENLKTKLNNSPEYIWRSVNPIFIANGDIARGNYLLVLDAHYLFSAGIASLKKSRPLFRLRSSPFADVQAWFGRHAARPGYLSVRP